MFIDIVAILLSLGLLIFLAYRGYPVIIIAPLVTILAVVLSGGALLPSYTETYMTNAANYIKTFFPIFLLGAVFGKIMDMTGAAASIAHSIVRSFGQKRAILAVVFACAALTYGGVSLFVVAFAVYPFAAAIFKEAGIPKRLIPASIALGAFTFTMDSMPGTPQIQNIIPTSYFGTDAYAAPLVGLTCTLLILSVGMWWLERQRKKALLQGEGYGSHHKNEPEPIDEKTLPSFWLSIIPLLLVILFNFIFSRTPLSVRNWYDPTILENTYGIGDVGTVVSNWSLIIALTIGILAAMLINLKKIRLTLAQGLTTAATGALLAIFNTASEVGFGNVVSKLPGFSAISEWVFQASDNPILSETIAVNVLAGITGSASGGLSIALELMGSYYLQVADTMGISPELLHRFASMASGSMDTLPHNGAVITLLAITGLTHRQSYKDIFVLTIFKTAIVFLLAIIVSLFI
ncbi:GntP family permease [Shouchella lehensis]|uniref:GntP family permease n=1 Tax=Shouchella lehensis TaxID=300825 RepID=A0A4Y7WJA7_9BACI|nr:GntP family permease [Shouchella lehensis]MBG9786032.1 transporter [Shouchella lehensis]TES48510.1 GntP family permease [Shouchella lehensis]